MATVICQGCGQAFGVPADYTRNKIQCFACGVICQVPAEAGSRAAPEPRPGSAAQERQSARPVVEEDAAAWLKDSESAVSPTETHQPATLELPAQREPEAEVTPVRKGRDLTFSCRRCGRPIKRQRECAHCGPDSDDPLPVDPDDLQPTDPKPAPVVGLAPRSMELDESEPLEMLPDPDDEWNEDPAPYDMAERDRPRCPRCRKEMEFRAVLCTSCGFNLRTRKKAIRRYVPIARTWETDLSLGVRLAIVGGVVGFHSLLTLVAILGGNGLPFAIAFVPLVGILSFALGTYDRITIIRDERGRVTLIKQWSFCFIPLPPQKTEVRGFEGVKTGGWNDSGFFEWIIFFSFLCLGIVPAFIWFYIAIYLNHYHVALAEDHGRPTVHVYRGRTEEQMHEIAKVLCNATGLQIIP